MTKTSVNDGSDMQDTLLRPAYDRISEWYDHSVQGGLPVHALVLAARCTKAS